MPNASWSTFAIGARQFVVHDAFEITVCAAASNTASFTPMQIMASASPLGAEMTTRLAPPLRCPAAFSRAVNRPVDSITTSTPWSPHGISAGSMHLELLDLAAVDREAVVGRLDLVGQRAADRVVLEQERHRVRVAEGSLTATSSTPAVAPGQQRPGERAADAAEAVDADPYRHVVSLQATCSRRSGLQQSREGQSPIVRGSWASPSARATSAGDRLDPERPDRGRRRPRAARRAGRAGTRSTRAPCRARPGGGRRRRGRRSRAPAAAGSPTWTTWAGAGDHGRRELGHAEHREEAGVQRSGREDDLVGRRDRLERGAGGDGASAGTSSTRRIRPAVFGHRDLALDQRRRRRSALRTTGSSVAGSTRPDGAAAVGPPRRGRRAKSPSVSVEPDEHQVAERVTRELAVAEAVLERGRPTRSSSSASATRHLRRSPGGGTPRSRRRRPERAAVVGDAHHRGDLAGVARGRRGASIASPCPPPSATTVGPPARSATVDVPVADVRSRRRASARTLRELARRSTTLRWRPPVQPTPIERYALPSRS